MEKTIIKIAPLNIIGLAVETTNENGQAAQDLGLLWQQFFTQTIAQAIPNKTSEDIYAIYTNYESDYRGKYTAIIGCTVATLDAIPDGLIGRTFAGGQYQRFLAKGAMPRAVQQTWQEIWAKGDLLERNYSADFEIYGAKSKNGAASEVAIYISLK